MATFAEMLAERQQSLIRKGLSGLIYVKKYDDADTEITALRDATGLLIPTGYVNVGHITKDQGATWTRDMETSDVESLGNVEPTRRDVVRDVSGLQFTMQESKKDVFELYDGVDLTGVQADANGNIMWDKPDRPALQNYRGLALFKDGDGVDAFYFARWLPKFQITERGEQVWNEENELQYSVTATAFVDDAFGTSLRSLWAVPTEMVTAMGFTSAPAV